MSTPKYFFALFQMEGHKTWRMLLGPTLEHVEKQLKTQLGNNKVTAKRFYEVDRMTGNIEEF